MAVTGKWYGKSILDQLKGTTVWDWDTDTIKVALCTNAYTPDQDVHDYFDDITNELPTAGGYTAGGATLTTPVASYTAGTNVVALDADDVVWSASTLTARYAIIYKSTGTPSTSPLIGYVDFGADFTSTSGPFTITWDSAGMLKITVS